MNDLQFIDLFAGTGAFTHVLKQYNARCVLSNDMAESSKKIYDMNHPEHKLTLKDLHDININEIPEHDILCGGFPCQPFSIAGQRLGFQDSRSNVFWKICEILQAKKPSIIILENVKNLKSHDNGNTYQTIESNLQNIGYHIHSKILDTSIITHIPQHRERIYIIGFLDRNKYQQFDFNFELPQKLPLSQFMETNVPQKYYYTNRLKVYQTIEDSVVKHIDTNTIYQFRRHYVRENKSNLCPTLTANMGGGGHNVPLIKDNIGIRKLTPRECFNLQGFPNNYQLPLLSDSALYKLAGNAVSVPVVKLIIEKISNLIS